ncbi:MAG: universal stress protein UspA related nucleotide-binding protein [uncultured archaeon A07HR60]|nr:MAG: universal stress protein UspA related nucleotide-binding protein [uncultured archaeon A07HR60]
MGDSFTTPTIVVPVDATESIGPPPAVLEFLSPHRVVVLGYYMVPSQASPEQLRRSHEQEAIAVTDEIAEQFDSRGADTESVVVFTHDRSETIDRVASESDADAVLTAGSVEGSFERVFVPLRGDRNIEPIVGFVGRLLANSDAEVTLFTVNGSEEAAGTEFRLRGAEERLVEDGVDSERITVRRENAPRPDQAILAASRQADLLIVGESEPSLRERIFGVVTNSLVGKSNKPVLVVRSS